MCLAPTEDPAVSWGSLECIPKPWDSPEAPDAVAPELELEINPRSLGCSAFLHCGVGTKVCLLGSGGLVILLHGPDSLATDFAVCLGLGTKADLESRGLVTFLDVK